MSEVVDVAGRVPERVGDWSEATDGRVTVTKRKFGPVGTRFARILRLSPDLRITLDAVGSAAWKGMDGRTVAALLRDLEAAFPEEGRMDERLGQYLAQLARAGLIRFA